MATTRKRPLGFRHGKQYTLLVKPPPSEYPIPDIDYEEIEGAITISIYYRDDNMNEQEIVRVDNSHDHLHIHKFYTESQEKEAISKGYWEIVKEFQKNWKWYADNYERAHN